MRRKGIVCDPGTLQCVEDCEVSKRENETDGFSVTTTTRKTHGVLLSVMGQVRKVVATTSFSMLPLADAHENSCVAGACVRSPK